MFKHFQFPAAVLIHGGGSVCDPFHVSWSNRSGLPDFSLYNIPNKRGGGIYQIAIKYPKWPQNIQNGCKIDHKICQHRRIARPSKIYPNLDFWYENVPSGNPETGIA
jgi:hypothetical protein